MCTRCADLEKDCIWPALVDSDGTLRTSPSANDPRSRPLWHSAPSTSRSHTPPRRPKRYKSALTGVTFVPALPAMGSTVEWFVDRDLARPRLRDCTLWKWMEGDLAQDDDERMSRARLQAMPRSPRTNDAPVPCMIP